MGRLSLICWLGIALTVVCILVFVYALCKAIDMAERAAGVKD